MPARKKHKNRVISVAKIHQFLENHPEHRKSETALLAWHRVAERSVWTNFGEVRGTYSHASQVGEFTVFNVGGNKFRVITEIYYGVVPDPDVKTAVVLIRHILTHEEYDENKWRE